MYPFKQVGIERESHPLRRTAVSFITGGAIVAAAILAKGAADAPDDSFASIPSITVFEDESTLNDTVAFDETTASTLDLPPIEIGCEVVDKEKTIDTDTIDPEVHTNWNTRPSDEEVLQLILDTRETLGMAEYSSEQFTAAALDIVEETLQQNVDIVFNLNGILEEFAAGPVDSIDVQNATSERIITERMIARGLIRLQENLDRYPENHFNNVGVDTIDISASSDEQFGGYFSNHIRTIGLSTDTIFYNGAGQIRVMDHELGHATHNTYCEGLHYLGGDPELSSLNTVEYTGYEHLDPEAYALAMEEIDPALFVPGPRQEFATIYSASSELEDYATIVEQLKNGVGVIQPGHASYGSPYQRKQQLVLTRESMLPGAYEAIMNYTDSLKYFRFIIEHQEGQRAVNMTEEDLKDIILGLPGAPDRLMLNGYAYADNHIIQPGLEITWPHYIQENGERFDIFDVSFTAQLSRSSTVYYGVESLRGAVDANSLTIPVWVKPGESLFRRDNAPTAEELSDVYEYNNEVLDVREKASRVLLEQDYELVNLVIDLRQEGPLR